MTTPADSFPRLQARTRHFTLGSPRQVRISSDGDRVAFLRSGGGADPVQSLWVLDRPGSPGRPAGERVVADPRALGDDGGEPTPEERARRERVRESASGIVAFGADAGLHRAVFALGGSLWLASLDGDGAVEAGTGGGAVAVDAGGPVDEPRLDPTGRLVAWCSGGALLVAPVEGGGSAPLRLGPVRRLAEPDGGAVSWGRAEFVAAEEMERVRGYWWAPDGSALLACRVDEAPVGTVWVGDPTDPSVAPRPQRYPRAGTANADVSLWILRPDGGAPVEVGWDRDALPYLAVVSWDGGGPPLLVVQPRDQSRALVLAVDVTTGATSVVAESADAAWVDWPQGLPAWAPGGELLWTEVVDDTRVLSCAGTTTPPGLQVGAVHGTGPEGVLLTGWQEPTSVGAWRWEPGTGALERLDDGQGVVLDLAGAAGTVICASRSMRSTRRRTEVRWAGGGAVELEDRSDPPAEPPAVRLAPLGPRRLASGVVLPSDHVPGRRLPVLLLPYGGPHFQSVLADSHRWLAARWWADQGFGVVVADGRGTPGRGPSWERAVHRDLAGPVLDDQVEALEAALATWPDLDGGRVGIMGWSFGGYLSALAVLRRPDRFHAAVAGAPVTEWRWYDTYYTERYLGHPGTDPEPYDRCSLLPLAAGLERPLMVVHGLADDNVLVTHSLQLSERLTAAGRPHTVLPLTGGVTHMVSQEVVAEHLLHLQRQFLRDALGAG